MNYDHNQIYDFDVDKIFADEGFNCRGHINPNDVDDLANERIRPLFRGLALLHGRAGG